MNNEIYAIRIKARHGHQKDNDHWRIGSYLTLVHYMTWTYDGVSLYSADFVRYETAQNIMKHMLERYPGVECEMVRFVETP